MRQLIKESIQNQRLEKIFTGKVFDCTAHFNRADYKIKFQVEHVNASLSFVVKLLEVYEVNSVADSTFTHDWMFLWNKKEFESDRPRFEAMISTYLIHKLKSYFGLDMTHVIVHISNDFPPF